MRRVPPSVGVVVAPRVSATQSIWQELIDAEAEQVIVAGKHERSDDRTTQRNGTRPRTLTMTAGDLAFWQLSSAV